MRRERIQKLVLAILALAAMQVCVFYLPYLFPPTIPTFAHSYLAGYSNRIATWSVSALAMTVFASSWFLFPNPVHSATPESKLSVRFLVGISLIFALGLGVLAHAAYLSPWYYGEAGYFHQRLQQMVAFGHLPYRDFEFAYGPLLLYLPLAVCLALKPFGVTLEPGYYASLILMTLAGLAMLYGLVNDSEFRIASKRTAFVLLALAMWNVTLGANFTPFRFLAAPFLLMRLIRAGTLRKSIAWAATSSVLAWSISPEAGAAFGGAASVFLSISAIRGEWSKLLAVPFAFAGFPAMLAIFRSDYLATFLKFSSGLGSMLIVPAPYILFFLITLTIVVPMGLALALRSEPKRWPVMAAVGSLALVYVSAALGRCDPGHVLWNGTCLFLLAFGLVPAYFRRFRRVYLVGFALLFVVGLQIGMTVSYLGHLNRTILAARHPEEATRTDFSALAAVDTVVTPFVLDKRTDEYLLSQGKLKRDPFVYVNAVYDDSSMLVKLAAVKRSKYLLADLNDCCYEDPTELIEDLMLYPLKYQRRHEPYSAGKTIREYVETHFDKVGKVGDYDLYRVRN